jgi:tRNA A-37 threonylcarbamoyl transferase component Bud32
MQKLLALHVRPGHPDFLDLPWTHSLADWRAHTSRLVEVQRGISRHEVVFVSYDDAIYAIKELPARIGEREYNLLRELESAQLPAVTSVGHARVQGDDEELSIVVTQYLDGSLPYRSLFMQRGLERYRKKLLGTIAGLLVRLHLAGFYWGDCSLSNTLFRRDAGALQAYVVDAETTEQHETLSKGQRQQDLMIMEENITGELADLEALTALPDSLSVYETGKQIAHRYEQLWKEITRAEVIAPSERYRIRERVRKLNELGFWVDEIELLPTDDGNQLRMRPIVADRNYHARKLHSLTGIVASDGQAKEILNDIAAYKASLSRELNRSVPTSNAAFRWLDEVYHPAIKQLAPIIDRQTDVPELYCEVLEHKWFMSERAKHDVGMEKAIESFVQWYHQQHTLDATQTLTPIEAAH